MVAAKVLVRCPNCNATMQVSAEHFGRRGRCPNCRSLIDIAPQSKEQIPATPIDPPATDNQGSVDGSIRVSARTTCSIGLSVAATFCLGLSLVSTSTPTDFVLVVLAVRPVLCLMVFLGA